MFSIFSDLLAILNNQVYCESQNNNECRDGSSNYQPIVNGGVVEKDIEKAAKKSITLKWILSLNDLS